MTTSTVSRKLFTGSAFLTLNFIAQTVVVFFLMPFVVKTLGDRLFGLWSLINAVIGYYGLLDFGLTMTVNRFMAKSIGADDKEESNDIFNTAFFVYSGIGIVVLLITIILFILTPHLAKDPTDSSLFSNIILIMGIAIAVEFPLKVYGGALNAKLRYDILSIIQMLTLALQTVLTVLVLVQGFRLLALIWITVISSALSRILTIYYTRKIMPHLRLQFNRLKARNTKMLFFYSSFAFISKLADELKVNVDVPVITAYLGLAVVTHYKIASTMVVYFRALVVSILGIFLPLFSQQYGSGDFEALKKSFFFCSRLGVCIAGFIGFGLVAWGYPFIQRWMGPQYLDAYPILVILTVACAVDMAQAASPAYLFATSNHRYFSLYSVAEGIFNVLLSLFLVKTYGMMGVALGTLIPLLAVKLVIQPLHVSRVMSISYFEYAKTMMKTVFRVLLSLVIPTLISVIFVVPDYRKLFLTAILTTFAYAFGIWLLEFSGNEKKMLLYAIAPRLNNEKATQ